MKSLDDCNVVWGSPSGDSFGSMPLGNGDVGLNVWVEHNGDLVFYVSKVDAFDAGHLLPKLGRVRLRLEPALDVGEFQQTLVLRDGAIEIKATKATLRVWVDANHPVVHLQGSSATPRNATLTAESLRSLQNAADPLPAYGTAGVLFKNNADRLAWCYRNQSSAWATNFANQNTPEMVAKYKKTKEELATLRRPSETGCRICSGTSYFGRTAIFELASGETLRKAVAKKADAQVLRQAATKDGMKPMRDEGMRLVLDGTTAMEEMQRVFAPKSGSESGGSSR